MSFPRYPEYKDSGVAWLGETPTHWRITPVKHCGRLKGGAGFPHAEQGHETGALPFHKVNALSRENDGSLWDSVNNISHVTAEKLGAFVFPARTIVFAKVGAALLLGRIRTLGRPACIDNNMMGLIVDERSADVAFERYALALVQFDLIANPGAVPSLNEAQIGCFPLVLPSLAEQTAIVAFLDRETGKIDALIAGQEKLIALLKEKRQALISHAVTKGLDSTAQMKDSGIEWLRRIPMQWNVCRLKRLGGIRYGIGEPPAYVEDGVPLIRATNVHAGKITNDGMAFVDPDDISEQRIIWLAEGDIIVVRSGAYTGDSALIEKQHCPSIAGFDMVVSPVDCRPKFLQYALLSAYLKNDQIDLEKLRAAQPHLNKEELGSCVVLLPGDDEQDEIVRFLDAQSDAIDRLVSEAGRAIVLLKERRSALISATVTGKIDVRCLVSAEAE